jgi:hypothetical protein
MHGNGFRRLANRLTGRPRYCSVDHSQNGNRASRAKCLTTPHDSDPTLHRPVSGLHSIIQSPGRLVLGECGSPHDFKVGVGCFGFQLREGRDGGHA